MRINNDMWKDYMNPIADTLGVHDWNDFHSNNTIIFGELIEDGFDWGEEVYYNSEEFTKENRERLNKKIVDRFYFREICCTPPGKFKHFLIRKLNEVLPKYNELYKVIDTDNFHVLREETKNSKNRHIYSEYPQSQLKGDADYATNGQDNAFGSTIDGPPVDMMIDFAMRYNDVDVLIMNELEVCFYSMLSNTINGGV